MDEFLDPITNGDYNTVIPALVLELADRHG
jgi:hypothetical protein